MQQPRTISPLGKLSVLIPLVVLLLGFMNGALAASVNVELEPDRVTAGEPFILSLVVPMQELPPDYEFPYFDNLQGMKLLKTDSTDDVQTGFFTRSRKVRKFRFHLEAGKQGSYRLGPLMWKVGGKAHSLGYVPVNVQRSYDAPGISVRVVPSRREVWQGEQLYLNLYIQAWDNYQGGLSLASVNLGNDFWAHRADMSEMKFSRSDKPGVRMEASHRIAWITPMKSGELTLPSLRFSYQKMGAPKVKEVKKGNFYSRSVQQTPEEAVALSSEVTIKSKPLPAGAPASFSGLVGDYSFQTEISSDSLQVGDALTLTITTRGNGRPGFIPEPKLPTFKDFRSVPPESEVSKNVRGGEVWTTRVLKIFLYPKKKGEFVLDPIAFAWFDPKKGEYREEKSPGYTIHVSPGDHSRIPSAAITDGVTAQQDIEALGKDIRYIHTGNPPVPVTKPLFLRWYYWLIAVLPFLLLWLLNAWRRYRIRRYGDRAFLRRKQAGVALRRHLAAARQAMEQSEARTFYTELEKGIIGYLSDQMNQEFLGMTLEARLQVLEKAGAVAPTLETYREIQRTCDAGQYAPGAAESQTMQDLYKRTEDWLRSLEDVL